MSELKIFTFNIRVNVDKGQNDFEFRKHRIAELINTEKPDIVGFQEATDSMRRALSKMLCGYYVVGCGRGKNYRGESAAVAFRTDKFELLELENFWMSATPSIPGSRYGFDQSSCPRISTALRLALNDGSAPFWFINTHLDHVGSISRILGVTQLMQYMSEKREGCILTGDFNALPDSKEMRALSENSELSLVDCTANISGTFHDYGRIENLIKIDYIYTNMECDVSRSFVYSDDAPNGTYYSDHLPVCAYIEVK